MSLEEQIRQDLIDDEGFRSKPYKDTVGKLTIGIGRNLDDKGISFKEAETMLENDVKEVFEQVRKRIPNFDKYPFDIKRALVNLGFNMGIEGLMGFKNTLKMIDEGKYADASENLLKSLYARQVPNRARRVAKMIKNAK